jgi:uncharacterized protein (AIM24 family)
MERFRFGEREFGRNGKVYTVNGWLAVFGGGAGHGSGKTGRCSLEIAGPKGGVRSIVVLNREEAGKLGAALMMWAGLLDYELTPEQKAKPVIQAGEGFVPRFVGDEPDED